MKTATEKPHVFRDSFAPALRRFCHLLFWVHYVQVSEFLPRHLPILILSSIIAYRKRKEDKKMSWISAIVFFILGIIVAMMIHTTTYDMCQEFMAQKFRHMVKLMNEWTLEQERATAHHHTESTPASATHHHHHQSPERTPATYVG
jgi:glucan phosphoethanolaminetransferase (alkaline phosphatase superfamily)